jgi:hypothetical protein
MNSHFSGLNNRQKINDYKKNNRREKLDTRKTSLNEASFNEENPIPPVSEEKLNKVKNEIKERMQKNNRKVTRLYTSLFVIVIIVTLAMMIKYNIF